MKHLNIKDLSITACGILVDSGFDEDEVLEIDYESNAFEDKVGADGETVRYATNDERATVTIKLLQTSTINDEFSALLILDRNTPNGGGCGPLFIRDRQGTTLYMSENCWIAKPPKASHGKEVKNREWVFRCDALKAHFGGN